MALQAIAAFFVPLSPEDTREMHRAAHRARVLNDAADSNGATIDVEDFSPFPIGFTPLRFSPPLAFVCAHPLCRVVAEGSPEGVQVGHTHYQRPEPPPLPSTTYVWDISPPPTPELVVHVTRLPVRTSGFAEGLWWMRSMGRTQPQRQLFSSPNDAVIKFPAFCPVLDIRVVLEREGRPARRRRCVQEQEEGESDGQGVGASSSPVAETGSKENPLREEDLLRFAADSEGEGGGDDDVSDVPFTSLELQQLCFFPAALRLLPCLFGLQLSTVLFSRCTCVFDVTLRDAQQTRYTTRTSSTNTRAEVKGRSNAVAVGVVVNRRSAPLFLPYGAAGLSYLSVSGCGSEAFWSCISKFFLYPQWDQSDGTPATSAGLALTPLEVLDVGDNKGLSTKQLQGVLRAVKQRNTVSARVPSAAAATSPKPDAPAEILSLRELNTSFTYAIKDVKWREEFTGLGCRLSRLAMARCDVAGSFVVDVLCAGDASGPQPLISITEEPFSDAVRRLLLLDMRWNLRVRSETIKTLRDDHAIHCKHLRVAGSGIDWQEGHRFATTVTP